jgi:hypothetical protein
MANRMSMVSHARFVLTGLISLCAATIEAAPLRTVVTSDQQVPGLAGVNFTFPAANSAHLSSRSMTINEAGQVAFWSNLSDGRHGVFTEAGPNGLTKLAVTGAQPIGTPTDSFYETFDNHVYLNDQGKTVYSGTFARTSQPNVDEFGAVYEFSSDGTTRLVARTNGMDPADPPTDRVLAMHWLFATQFNQRGDIVLSL